MANRPMNEDFANSGWKEKKLWAPPVEEVKQNKSPTGGNANPPRLRLRAEGPAPGVAMGGDKGSNGNGTSVAASTAVHANSQGTAHADAAAGPAAPAHPAPSDNPPKEAQKNSSALAPREDRPRKQTKSPKGPLEALDPDSSSEESEAEGVPAEYAVLDMAVPRTALVFNVSHVLKRLNGCCSLNQLTKAVKGFKEKNGVTLEAFLRANPMTFMFEGRIVYLVDRDGGKWKPPPQQEAAQAKGGLPVRGGYGVQPPRGGKSADHGAGVERPSRGGKGEDHGAGGRHPRSGTGGDYGAGGKGADCGAGSKGGDYSAGTEKVSRGGKGCNQGAGGKSNDHGAAIGIRTRGGKRCDRGIRDKAADNEVAVDRPSRGGKAVDHCASGVNGGGYNGGKGGHNRAGTDKYSGGTYKNVGTDKYEGGKRGSGGAGEDWGSSRGNQWSHTEWYDASWNASGWWE